jgi:integrase
VKSAGSPSYNRETVSEPKPTRRADGRYMIQFPIPGTSRRSSIYGRTAAECIAKYRDRLTAGRYRVRPGSISEFYATEFAEWIRNRVQPESVARYNSEWLAMVGPAFGHFRFDEITPSIVQTAFSASSRSPASLTNARGLLLQIVKLAVAMNRASPAAMTCVQIASVESPTPKRRRDVAIAANRLLARASAAGHWIAGPLFAAIMLGLRKGEVCGLKRADLDGNVLTVERQRNTRGEKSRLKSRRVGESRRIALPPEIADRLASFWNRESIYLFTTDAGRPIPYQHLDRAMRPFQDDENPVSFHAFRAAAICNLIDAGVSDHSIMDLVGHSSASMIREYRDHRDERIRAALESVIRWTPEQ